MRINTLYHPIMLGVVMLLCALGAQAADPPQPQQGDFFVKDFRLHTGEVLPGHGLRLVAH